MNQFQEAADRWNAEINREAAKLVEDGHAPWEAMRIAQSIVRDRRRVATGSLKRLGA